VLYVPVVSDLQDLLNEFKVTRSPERKIELLLDACRTIQYDRPQEAIAYAQQAVTIARSSKLGERQTHALRMVGICQFAMADHTSALETFLAALKRARRERATVVIGRTLQNIGLTLHRLGRHEEALQRYRESESVARETQDVDALKAILTNIGAVASILSQPSIALAALSECLTLAERTGDNATQARVMGNIADEYQKLGDIETGIAWTQRSLDLHRQLDDRRGAAFALVNLARIARSSGDAARAVTLLEEAIASSPRGDDIRARAHWYLASIHVEYGRTLEAASHVEKATDIFTELHDTDWLAWCATVHAEIALRRGRPADADAALARAKSLAARTENSTLQAEIHRLLANVAIRRKDNASAIRHLTTALRVAVKHGMHAQAAEAHSELARLHEQAGALHEALQHERKAAVHAQAADAQVRARHSQALNLQLEMERTARERALMELHNQRLTLELDHKARELNASALSLAQKNEVLASLSERLTKAMHLSDDQRTAALKGLQQEIDRHRRTSQEWRSFTDQLSEVHDAFRQALLQRAQLSARELQIASLIKLNLSSKEIADLTTIDQSTVDTYRFRLRKKLGLAPSDNLAAYLQSL
jgi:tetratricopeptide (TPR) repeat protein